MEQGGADRRAVSNKGSACSDSGFEDGKHMNTSPVNAGYQNVDSGDISPESRDHDDRNRGNPDPGNVGDRNANYSDIGQGSTASALGNGPDYGKDAHHPNADNSYTVPMGAEPVSSDHSDHTAPDPRRENPVIHEVRLFLTAVMFYTRIPCPRWVGYSDEHLNQSTRYFPAMGWIVGCVVAGVIWLVQLGLPVPVAVVLGLGAGVLLTGGFHEDGFADVCDGFGGGTSRQRTLDIMKDSRVGAFAVIGLVLLFACKITALTSLISDGLWAGLAGLVYAHVLSRVCVVTIIFTGTYARDDLTSKVKPIGRQISWSGMIVAALWLLPFAGLAWWHPWWLIAIPVAVLLRIVLARWFTKRLGGYTGDCLGAAQQIMEVAAILVCLGFAGAGL